MAREQQQHLIPFCPRVVRRVALARLLNVGAAVLAMAAMSIALAALAAPALAAEPSAAEKEKQFHEMMKWYARINFFGEEDTGRWSLRVFDKETTEPATIQMTGFWKLDPATKKWVKLAGEAPPAKIVLPKDKPANSPPDTQVIADLPIEPQSVGLFYVKWEVNHQTQGAIMTKIGPGLVGAAAKEAAAKLPKAPEGHIVQVVPLSLNEAQMMIIPDPKLVTGAEAPAPAPKK